jgi:plastocyanin
MLKRKIDIKLIPYLILSIYFIFLVFGCGNKKPEKNRGQYEIWMKNISYIPDTLNVPVGTTVTWTNQDSVAHTVTSGDTVNSKILFDSHSIGIGDSFSHKFDSSGVYHYHCDIHAKRMHGVVVVQ